jgi:hypothetical protein
MAWHKRWEFPVGLDSSPAWCGMTIMLSVVSVTAKVRTLRINIYSPGV